MRRGWVVLLALVCCSGTAFAAQGSLVVDTISPAMQAKVDAAAEAVLAKTGVPSASVAIVEHGAIVYTHAYGNARLNPTVAATPAMRYSIGSVSKQFTATAMLMLQQEGKLSINDPVSKYLPGLTRANEVTIRMLLSHTSGYEDYWPQDYVMPPMKKPTTAQHILDVWGKKPLNFDPGTKWQYSNTNYVIAGKIVEQVSGEPLMEFLRQHIFTPLHMDQVRDSDAHPLGVADAEGFTRFALGPLRPAPKEGSGWMFGAGELAMPAYDLAQWDISIMDRSLLAAKSYKEMFTPVLLKDGENSHYALGLFVRTVDGRKELEHSGEVSGFVSENVVFPKDKAAIVVLTNQIASNAAYEIGQALTPVVLGLDQAGSPEAAATAQARAIFLALQHGQINRSLFTADCNAYFDQQARDDFASSLAPLGAPATFTPVGQELRGGMTFREYSVSFAHSPQKLMVTTYTMPDGKLEQYLVIPQE